MEYVINVSINGHFFFRAVTDYYTYKHVYSALKEKFPKSEGFLLTVTRWEKVGTTINMDD